MVWDQPIELLLLLIPSLLDFRQSPEANREVGGTGSGETAIGRNGEVGDTVCVPFESPQFLPRFEIPHPNGKVGLFASTCYDSAQPSARDCEAVIGRDCSRANRAGVSLQPSDFLEFNEIAKYGKPFNPDCQAELTVFRNC